MKNWMALRNDTEEDRMETSISIWLKRIDECYQDFDTRINEDIWRKLLEDDVCVKDNSMAEKQLLEYLMSSYRLPKPIWRLLDESFKWTTREEELYNKYPRKFIDFVLTSIEEEDKVCYDQMRVGSGVSSKEIDRWIRTYYSLEVYYVLDDMEQLKKTLDLIKSYDITYPRIEFIEQYYWEKVSDGLCNKVNSKLTGKGYAGASLSEMINCDLNLSNIRSSESSFKKSHMEKSKKKNMTRKLF